MAVDPNIAMSYRGVELPNQLAQFSQMAQLRNADMQAQQMQMQMDKLRRTDEAMERIRQTAIKNGGPGDLNEIANAFLQSPDLGHQELGLKIIQQQKDKAEFEQTAEKLYPGLFGGRAAPANALAATGGGAAPAAPANALMPTAPAAAPAVNALAAPSGKTADQLRQELMVFSALSDPRAKAITDMIKGQLQEATKAHVVGGSLVTGAGTPIYQAPDKPTELVRNYEYAKKQGYKGDLFDYEREISLAKRPFTAAQPVAPTITQIVDPTNPNQMISIDARRYSGGGVGSAGVLGVGGKEPGAALRANKAEEGKTQLQDELDNLRGAYDALNQAKAIQSTERGALSNIAAATQGSALGQMVGRAVGTKEQVERDVINSAKQRLVVAIKNATGMSAQQLNSNVELQTMLKSLSDPSQGYDAAMRIIDSIEEAYVRGKGMPKRTPTSLSPQDQEALAWANANPKDPRAAQIKQQLGVK